MAPWRYGNPAALRSGGIAGSDTFGGSCRPTVLDFRLFMTAPNPLLTYEEFVAYEIPLAVAQAICQNGGIPEPTSIRRLKRGEVNAVFLVELSDGELLVLKVWVRCSDDEVMRREERVVRFVQRESPVPTPPWIYVSSGDTLVPYPHVLIEYAAGVDGDQVWNEIGFEDKVKILTQCARHLRALHSIPIRPCASAILVDPINGSKWREAEENRFERAVGLLRKQGWLGKDILDRCDVLWTEHADTLGEVDVDAIVHHDFQLQNFRLDQATRNLTAVLDFGNAAIAPAFTDARDLYLSLFINTPVVAECFWQTYGILSYEQERILKLHSLARLLDVLAAYQGPTPGGWDRTTVLKLLE